MVLIDLRTSFIRSVCISPPIAVVVVSVAVVGASVVAGAAVVEAVVVGDVDWVDVAVVVF